MNREKKKILSFSNVDACKNIVADTLQMAIAAGASQAEAGLSVSQGLSVATRMRAVETIEHQQDNGLGISVYFGRHKGSASTSNLDPAAIRKTVEAACNIARYTSEDPCTGLADEQQTPFVREADESLYWMELLLASGLFGKRQLSPLYKVHILQNYATDLAAKAIITAELNRVRIRLPE